MRKILEMILDRAESTPGKTAIWTDKGAFTYEELCDFSYRAAAALKKEGLRRGDGVTIELPRCKEYVGFMLGAWMLGGFFVPSDSGYPKDRKDYIAGDCKAKVRVTPEFLEKMGPETLDCDPEDLRPEDKAFIVYTSGSTGKPKGVIHSHRSVSAMVDRVSDLVEVRDTDRFANLSAFTFVVGTANNIALLACGCPDYIVPADVRINLNKLSEFNSDHGITIMFMAPAMLPYYRQKTKTLRMVFIGGERAVKVWSDDFTIVNLYGSSETCGMATGFFLDRAYDRTPLGKPLKGVCAYVLDGNGREAEEGEICFTGHFSDGYLNLPEATAKAFVANPFRDRDGYDIMIRTGDIGRRLEDGSLLYLERNDWMVNINGQRVEPGEISGVMMTMPGIIQAAVKDFKGTDGQTFLCAYYAASGDIREDSVRDFLRSKLPGYMVPAYLVRMDRLPLNQSGKIDRHSLPDPTAPGSGSAVTAGPTDFEENAVTKGVREILKELTGRDDFRFDENLVYCGLSSLTAIKFASEAMGRFGVDLDVSSMLGGCSIASVSGEIIAKLVEKAVSAPAEKKALRDRYPLTKPQMGVYQACYADPETVMYNLPMQARFAKEQLAGRDLEGAVRKAIEAHPGLKCTIEPDGRGEMCMVPHPDAEVRIERIEGSESDLEEYRGSFVRPFDMSEGLYRAAIFDTGDAETLLMDFSHIMFDGSSSLIFMDDLRAALSGREPAAETFTMFDLSDEESGRMSSGDYSRSEKYYSELLSDADGTSVIQRDVYGEARVKGHLRAKLDLDPGKLKAFAESAGATENAFFQSAMGFALSRFNCTDDSCHATVYAGRKGGRTSRLVGMLVRTLPVVQRFDPDESPGALVRRTGDQLVSSMQNDIFPFSEISARFGVTSDVLFAYQGILDDESVLDSQMEIRDIKNSLTVQVYPMKDGFLADLEYDASMYSEGLMRSFLATFGRCALGFVGAPTLRDVEVSGEEDAALLREVNSTDSEYDRSKTIVDMFRARAAERPDDDAVLFDKTIVSYSELDRITDHIASYISSKGIGKDQFVSILVPRSAAMVVAALGVVKSGAAYQPLDPTYPEERLLFMMRDSGVRLMIADRSLAGLVRGYECEILYTDEFGSRFAGRAPDASALSPSPEDAFVILYTSGTTGTPKGCVLENGNIAAFADWYGKKAELGPGSRYATYASFGFDACMMDVMVSLSRGACIAVIPDGIRSDLGALDRFFSENGITHGFMTTQMGRMFMETAGCRTLKHFFTGGEALVPLKPPEWLDFYNLYGPTETTVSVTSFLVKDDSPLLPIGKPNTNVRVYVLDGDRRIVPTGACGELCISGPQVFRGYLNNPEKTAAVLVDNPYSDCPEHDRMYRTGDIVRLLPDGNVDYIGRRDGMVKVRGFRIELTEVERAIRAFEGIRDATVQAFDAPSGGKQIAAYVVSDGKVDVRALESFILQTKPPYMVPAVIMQLDSIPLTVNSKVDRRKLPVPSIDMGEVSPPQTDIQKRIFRIASEVLGTDRFGIDTDLFRAGLTSISGIRFNVLLSDEFGIPFRSKDIKENSTVAKLEKLIESSAPARTYEIQDDYPLTKSQEGVFVECMARPDSTIYNIPLLIRYDSSLDGDRLKAAIADAVNAHPFMMATLAANDSGDIRLVRKGLPTFFPDEIEEISADSLDAVLPGLAQPFRLIGSRLFRIKLVHAGGDHLFVEMHHIISDGTSMKVLLDDISKAYSGEKPEPERFSGFEASLKEADERTPEALAAAKKYYEDLLAGYDRDSLPRGDRYRPDPGAAGTLMMKSGGGLGRKLAERCERAGITMNGLLCAAFGYVLARYSGSEHSIFATIYNGRSDSRTMGSVSMYVKTLPVLCDVSDDSMSPLRLSERIGDQILDSMANDIYSFAEISRELEVKADVMFVYQGDGFRFDRFCGKPSESVQVSLSGEKEPILFQVAMDGDELAYMVEFDRNRFTPEFMEFFAKSFDRAVSEFPACTMLREVDLTEGKTLEAVARMNDTAVPFDMSATVVDMFRRNARERPGNIAAVYMGDSLTYGELDEKTDYIADYIHSKGIGKDEYVAVLVPRSLFMVIAAEGVIKSGAAYQPLDPTYPEERLLFMMQDSGTRLLIADRSLRGLVSGYGGDVLYTDEIDGLCSGRRPDVASLAPSPEDAFIILYTSGTTGTPKGCVLEHRNIVSFLKWMIPEVGHPSTSRYASYASYGFDACMMDIHSSLSAGAAVHIIPEEMRKDLAEIDRYFISSGITHGFMTTQMGRMFMEATQCRSLKAFMAGGERLVPLNPPGWVDFYNIYGPTECTVNVTTFKVRDDSPLLPIGRPNTNVKLYVLDRSDRIVPVGCCGELCISGPQVFREYLNNPEKTAKTVTRSPFSDGPGFGRLYRTGDVVRMLPDGNIDYIGRRDGMVKVRGFRIELAEVEGAVRGYPGIKDATVKAFDDPAGGKSITAYVVSDSQVDFRGLADFIRSSKPPYMVPAHFVQLDSIPMTVNGKVDRRKLPEPSSEPRKAGREPSGPTETKLCEIFAGVLGLKKVYADDDFFEIGGTSISASKLVLSCMNAGFPIVYKNVFDNPSPEALARFMGTLGKAGEEEKRAAIDESPLAANVEGSLDSISSHSPRRILLTGATGYLGAHVLWELLRRNAKHVACLVRSGKGQTSEERLKTVFMYYFGGMAPDDPLKSVEVIDGDITDKNLKEKLEGRSFDTIINCAAVVKHFAADDSIEKVNVGGVRNLIGLAESTGSLLVQISTESVAGESVNGSIPADRKLKESELDFGQNLDNKYARSKFMAEEEIIKAIPGGLKAKIIRVGNLMSRDSDGEFQINFGTNAFMKQMRSYVKLGFFPVTDMDTEVEFSPIDMVAKAVVILAGTPEQFTAFHVNNCHKVHMANVLKVMRDNGMPVEVVSRKEFDRRFTEAMKDEANEEFVSGLISYLGNAGETRRFVAADDAYTVKALYRLGFSWPIISDGYIDKAFKTLKSLRFFR